MNYRELLGNIHLNISVKRIKIALSEITTKRSKYYGNICTEQYC